MKPSDIFKKMTSLLGNSAEIGSHLHTATSLFGVLKGNAPSQDAPAMVRGLYGVFGQGDERAMEVLVNQLEEEWHRGRSSRKGPNPREVLAGFFAWHFTHTTSEERLLTWWYGNAFRSFVTKMGSADGRAEGSEEKVVESKEETTGATTKTILKKELRSEGNNNALEFLRMMVRVICSEPEQDAEPKRLLGYQKLLTQFKAFGYPHIPEDTARIVRNAVQSAGGSLSAVVNRGSAEVVQSLTRVADKIEAEVARREQEVSSFRRFLRKI